MKNRIVFILAIIFIFSINTEVQGKSVENNNTVSRDIDLNNVIEETQNNLLRQLEFDEINKSLKELFPESKLDFVEIMKDIIYGELEVSADLVNRLISDQVSYAFRVNKDMLGHMLVLVILSALFTNFSQIFQNKQIGDIGFYVVYMLMITLAIKSFGIAVVWAEEGIGHLVGFMKVLCPVYFLAVAIAKGSVSSVVFYNITLLLIFLIELLIAKIMIPIIQVYIMVRFLDCLSEEEYLSKFSELMEVGIGWVLKVLLGLVIGLNTIQGLIAPAIDSVKRSAITKGAEAIPGIGDVLGGMAEVVLGTAVLVKNGIGAAGALICIGICTVPVVQIAILTFLYKLSAALVQPVSDKRMVQCLSNVGEGCQILLKLIFTVAVLFLITIAIVAATT